MLRVPNLQASRFVWTLLDTSRIGQKRNYLRLLGVRVKLLYAWDFCTTKARGKLPSDRMVKARGTRIHNALCCLFLTKLYADQTRVIFLLCSWIDLSMSVYICLLKLTHPSNICWNMSATGSSKVKRWSSGAKIVIVSLSISHLKLVGRNRNVILSSMVTALSQDCSF